MKRLLLTLIILVLSACLPTMTTPIIPTAGSSTQEIPMTPTPQPSPTAMTVNPAGLKRGVNMGNMLEAPNEGEWGLFVKEEYFDLIKQAGFDFVRLPVRWFAHTTYVGYDDGDTSYKIDPEFFARVDEVVGWALERDLAIIIDFHHFDELMAEPNLEQFLFIWEQIAEHYKDYPPQVMFELLNEPNGKLTAPLWNLYAHYALRLFARATLHAM